MARVYNIQHPRDYALVCPPGMITTTNLAELSGYKRATCIRRCRMANIIPLAIPRRNINGMLLGGKPVFVYPRKQALAAVFAPITYRPRSK